MKSEKIAGLFLVLAAVVAVMAACSSNNSPSSPSSPAPTNTFTFTPTYTFTCGNATGTCTPTNSFTPTNTFTPSDTFTVTNTPTVTFTPTNTNTPTITPTPTDTSTATATNTPCTCTPTPTIPSCPSFTPSITPGPANNLSGTVTYTGSLGPVDSTHPLYVFLNSTSSYGYTSWVGSGAVTVNGGTYTVNVAAPATYYLGAMYDTTSGGIHLNNWNDFPVGGVVLPYGGYPTTIGFYVNGSTAGPNISFGDTSGFRVLGIYGYANYTGSMGGVGSQGGSCHNILIKAYADSACTTPVSIAGYGPIDSSPFSNNTRFDAEDSPSDSPSNTYYWLMWYDVTGSAWGTCSSGDTNPCPHTGDPSTIIGPYNVNYTNIGTVNFGDSHLR